MKSKKSSLTNRSRTRALQFPKFMSLLVRQCAAVALLGGSISPAMADDTACEVTLGGSGLIDTRSFPTTSGDTVLNGRNDGNPATCIISSVGTLSTVNYPNGLLINSGGTGLVIGNVESDIANGFVIDDGGIGTGLVTFNADQVTRISGPVDIRNSAKLKLITYNTRSSGTRLLVPEAYFNIAAGSELQLEFKLGDTTGSEISVGAIQGDGDLRLFNAGKTTEHALIFINNRDDQDYTYSGDIYYSDQSLPSITKNGKGTFTFTGDVKKASGDSVGFTDGFHLITINDGAFETTTEAFVLGTRVFLQGGDLILNQATDGSTRGAQFIGNDAIYKRGVGAVSLANIDSLFKGNVFIEEGSLGLLSDASLAASNSITIDNGALLDLSQISSSTRLSRVVGSGTIVLGTKNVSQIVSIEPGNSIGTLSVTGTGNFNIGGALIKLEMDPTRAPGNVPGTTHDLLQVQGNVTLGAAPLIQLVDTQQAASPTAFLNGREFTVLTAAGGLAGISPSAIQEDPGSFHAFVGADPESTIITDTSISVKFGTKTVAQASKTAGKISGGSSQNTGNSAQQYLQQTTGLSGNQQPTQQQLQTNPALQNLTSGNLSLAASNNNPEAYSSNLTITLEYADLVANSAMDHASGAGIGLQQLDGTSVGDGRVWIDAAYVDGDIDGSDNHTGAFGYNLGTFVIGSDLIRDEKNTFGVFGGAGQANMDEHDNIRQDIDSTFLHLGAYNQYRFSNGYRLSGLLGIFKGDYESSRQNIDTNGLAAPRSDADFSSYGATIGAKLFKSYAASPSVVLTPSLGLTFTRIKQDAINEENGGTLYDYRIEKTEADAVVLGVGLDTSYALQESSTPMVADFRVRYEYDAYAGRNDTHDISAGLEGQPSSSFVGQNRGEHGLILGAGITGRAGESTTVGGGVLYALHSNGSEISLGANVTVFW